MARGRPDRNPTVGVIDIGSNSIRLVVFAAATRALEALFNEKVLCGLGRGLEERGRLSPEGVRLALENLPRFAAIARGMGVGHLATYATAAVRDASDGPSFIARVKETCDLDVAIISGEEEARLSALGVVSAMPEAEGLVGDLGGGSLELVHVQAGRAVAQATLPLGPFRLMRLGSPDKVTKVVDDHLDRLDWLGGLGGQPFYPVGGSWRTVARIHMSHVDYPLKVIHHYAMDHAQAEELAGVLSRLGRKTLQRLRDVPRRRRDTLPYAGLVLQRLVKRLQPSSIVFSAYGLREGIVFDRLSAAERAKDPLIEACARVAAREGRFHLDGRRLLAWMKPLFPDASSHDDRLREAACWLGDIAGLDHPDYRGQHAFYRALRMPVVGIDHPGRAFVGLALLARYEGAIDATWAELARQILPPARVAEALVTGLALRLAYAIAPGTPTRLDRTALALAGGSVELTVPTGDAGFGGEALHRRFEALSAALGREQTINIAA